jgi:anti-sigma factor RsiW
VSDDALDPMEAFDEQLSALLDDELAPDERAAVDERLAHDEQARGVLAELVDVRGAVRALPWPEPADGVMERIVAAVANDGVVSMDEARTRRRRVMPWMAAASIAAAIAVAIVLPARVHRVAPPVATLTQAHGAQSSDAGDPLPALASVAVPVRFAR